jgi:hypothetical protein
VLSDPQNVTYNGASKSLPVTGVKPAQIKGLTQFRSYTTPDGEFRLLARQYSMSDGNRKTEIEFQRSAGRDLDGNSSVDAFLSNGFGVTVTVNPFNKDSLVEVPLLRDALISWLTTPVLNRIVGGEL